MKELNKYILFLILACITAACGEGIDDYISDEKYKREEPKVEEPQDPEKPEDPEPEPVPEPEPEPLPVYPTFNDPKWADAVVKSYENTMVVTVQLPDSLISSFNMNDKMAVLCGNEVRGVLDIYTLSATNNVWMGMVAGNGGETLRIGYYSATNYYLYYSSGTFPFVSDTHYGTIGNPIKQGFTIVTQ